VADRRNLCFPIGRSIDANHLRPVFPRDTRFFVPSSNQTQRLSGSAGAS
jgi:hypothetical protein